MSAKHQSLQEWHAAGGGVPVRFKGKEHIWHKQVEQHLSIGGELAKVAAKAAKPAAKAVTKVAKVGREVLPAVEREANLAKFLAPSAEKRRMYHGSKEPNIKEFKTRKDLTDESHMTGHYADERDAVFLSPEPQFTTHFSKEGYTDTHQAPTTYPVYAQIERPFDFDNPEHLGKVKETYLDMYHNPDSDLYDPHMLPSERSMAIHTFNKRVDNLPNDENNWARIENQDFQDVLKDLGFDSFYTRERGTKNLGVYEPNRIKSATGNRGTYDTTKPDLNEAHGGAIHMAGGGDPRKRAMYPKMPTQAIIDSPGFDPEVPSDLSRAYARRMADKDEYERNIKDQKLTPTQRGVAGLEAAGMLGSAMFEGVQQLPKLLDSQEAYESAVDQGMYRPRFQPEKAVEYAGNVGDFLEQLETKYKMPQVLPELLGFAPLAEAAKRQAGKAVKQGAMTAASRMEAGPKAGSMAAQRGVIKMPGGNFLNGRIEKNVAPLKTRTIAGETPAQRIPKHEELLKDPSLNQDQLDRVKYQLEETKKDAALDKWVDSNLSNYIKKQLGTPDDPVRSLAEQGITHKPSLLDEYPIGSIDSDSTTLEQRKAAGFPAKGMAQSPLAKAWEYASDSSIASHRAGDIQEMPGKFAKRDEAERKMIAARDALYNKFVDHLKSTGISEDQANFVARETPFDLKARTVGDQDFLQANTEYLATHDPMMSSYIALGRENPWISKVAPETQLYSPFTGDLGFDHIIDVLKQDVAEGRIRPEQLSKVSMEQAVRRTYEYDQEMAKRMRETQAKVTEGMPVHKDYPEGYKWVELTKPKDLPSGYKVSQNEGTQSYQVLDKNGQPLSRMEFDTPDEAVSFFNSNNDNRLEDALKYEGDTMGHCVGGYCPDVAAGRSRIYSLRDAKGEPHVTVETKPVPHPVSTSRRGDNFPDLTGFEYGNKYSIPSPYKPTKDQLEQIHTRAYDLWSTKGTGRARDVDDFYQQAANEILGPMPEEIKQIKGKGNRAPKEEYLPFVQDFVKGGNWRDVNELRNAGLTRKSDLIDKFSPDELDAFGSGEYLTKAEHDDLLLKALRPPEEGMKAGGRVNRKHFHEQHFVLGGKAISKAASMGAKAAKPAAKAAEKVSAPAVIPNLLKKSTASEIGREERARRQAAGAAEQTRQELAKQTPMPIGYVKHTEKSPNPHVGYRYEAVQHPGIQEPIPIDLAKLEREKKGASLGVIPWDSQSRNVEVSSISGEPLTINLDTHGGQPYALDEKHLEELIGGSSAKEVADAIKERDRYAIKENLEKGGTGEVVHAVTTMGKYGENYAHTPSEFAFELINRRLQEGRLSNKDLDYLNNLIRTQQDKKIQRDKGIFPYANFAGFETPEGLEQIYKGGLGLQTSPGNLRKAIAENLHKVKQQELLGFNSEDFINATSEPSLRGVDKGYIGGTLLSNDIGSAGFYGPRKDRFGMELAPSSGFPYESPYSTDFSARYYGQLPEMIPLDVVMHRQLAPLEQGFLARPNKKPYTEKSLRNAAIGSLEKSNEGVSQIMDDRFFQDLSDYMEALKKPLEKKAGGLAQSKKPKKVARHGNTVPN
jgi:hypothetical protein